MSTYFIDTEKTAPAETSEYSADVSVDCANNDQVPRIQTPQSTVGFDPPARTFIAPVRLLLPTRYTELEPPVPLSVINDDPIFNTCAAAAILAVTCSKLKGWRQQRQGPDFIQYGEDGPIRYSLSALRRFIAQNTVKSGQNR